MEWGSKEDWLTERSEAVGYLLPALARKPTITLAESHFLDAFLFMSSSRPSGGAIPLSEYVAFFALMGISDPEDRAEYLRFCRALDDEYLRIVHKE